MRSPWPPWEGLSGAASDGELIVMAGANGSIFTSSDGESWTSRASGTTSSLCDVTYGDGLSVAVGDGGTIVVSTDGITWEGVQSGATARLDHVVRGDGLFVAVESNENHVRLSEDGVHGQPVLEGQEPGGEG